MSLQIGDRIAYCRAFLQSTGILTGEIPFWRGTLTEIQDRIATVEWKNAGSDAPSHILISNLAKVGSTEY